MKTISKLFIALTITIILTISGCQFSGQRYCPGGNCPTSGPSPYSPQNQQQPQPQANPSVPGPRN